MISTADIISASLRVSTGPHAAARKAGRRKRFCGVETRSAASGSPPRSSFASDCYYRPSPIGAALPFPGALPAPARASSETRRFVAASRYRSGLTRHDQCESKSSLLVTSRASHRGDSARCESPLRVGINSPRDRVMIRAAMRCVDRRSRKVFSLVVSSDPGKFGPRW